MWHGVKRNKGPDTSKYNRSYQTATPVILQARSLCNQEPTLPTEWCEVGSSSCCIAHASQQAGILQTLSTADKNLIKEHTAETFPVLKLKTIDTQCRYSDDSLQLMYVWQQVPCTTAHCMQNMQQQCRGRCLMHPANSQNSWRSSVQLHWLQPCILKAEEVKPRKAYVQSPSL
jgi:hypothetical protein